LALGVLGGFAIVAVFAFGWFRSLLSFGLMCLVLGLLVGYVAFLIYVKDQQAAAAARHSENLQAPVPIRRDQDVRVVAG
jgi:hypothetical protein